MGGEKLMSLAVWITSLTLHESVRPTDKQASYFIHVKIKLRKK